MFEGIYLSEIQDTRLYYCYTIVLVVIEFSKAQQFATQ